MTEILPAESFGNFQGIGCGMAVVIQPTFVIESLSLNDEGIPVLLSDGVAKPCWIRIVIWKCAAVRENLTIRMNGFVKDDDHSRHLKNLERIWHRIRSRHSADNAVGRWIVLTVVRSPLL